MNTAYLGLGANLGDRDAALRQALQRIDALPDLRVTDVAPWYETDPVGVTDQPAFLNTVCRVQTPLDPVPLRRALADVEAQCGREPLTQRVRWGPRLIDIDILLMLDHAGEPLLSDDPEAQVPHPRLHERWFVLQPLADLAPDLVHPRLNRSVTDLLKNLDESAPRGRPYAAGRSQS